MGGGRYGGRGFDCVEVLTCILLYRQKSHGKVHGKMVHKKE